MIKKRSHRLVNSMLEPLRAAIPRITSAPLLQRPVNVGEPSTDSISANSVTICDAFFARPRERTLGSPQNSGKNVR